MASRSSLCLHLMVDSCLIQADHHICFDGTWGGADRRDLQICKMHVRSAASPVAERAHGEQVVGPGLGHFGRSNRELGYGVELVTKGVWVGSR
jgi:hypothetical protein